MEKLNSQENKVYRYIEDNYGCTTHDIQADLFIQCPSARITKIRQKGYPLVGVGLKKYPNTKPFVMYAIKELKQEVLI